tara:strand:+ start:157 stop:654 length:498 start_codon:yes stop_codon:yes gene_type:complete
VIVNKLSAHISIVLSFVLMASSAKAGWQETNWGMTVEEVSEVTGAKRKQDEGKRVQDLVSEMSMPYVVDGMTLEANFLFDETGGLAMVQLTGRERDCSKFANTVPEIYGAPETQREVPQIGVSSMWRDLDEKNLVTLLWSGIPAPLVVFCQLSYEPMPVKGSGGL